MKRALILSTDKASAVVTGGIAQVAFEGKDCELTRAQAVELSSMFIEIKRELGGAEDAAPLGAFNRAAALQQAYAMQGQHSPGWGWLGGLFGGSPGWGPR